MDNNKIAAQVIAAVGGKQNIISVEHCATRLRIIVKNEDSIDTDAIENIEKVKGAFFNAGQFQIIFGTGTVNKIYTEVHRLLDLDNTSYATKTESNDSGNDYHNIFKRIIRVFGDVFVPIIPVLVATGLFMGLRGLITQPDILQLFGMTPESINENFLTYTQILTDTAFAFLPALVAWSTFRVFGGSPVIGIVLGLMLVNPALPNAYEVAAGSIDPIYVWIIPVVGYQGTILPALITGILGAKFEKWLRKWVPDTIDLLVTPFITLLVMSSLALFLIGPIFHSFEEVILAGTQYVLGLPFGLAGIIIGFLNQLIVITGVHHIFNFLEVQLLANTGGNPFNAIITGAIAAQGGAALAVGCKTKSGKLKTLSFSSALSAFLGITEPAIFGVNLRYGKPFVMGLIGGAVGGFFASIMHLEATGMSVTVIPGALLYLNGQLGRYFFVNTISIAIAFVLTYFIGYKDQEDTSTS